MVGNSTTIGDYLATKAVEGDFYLGRYEWNFDGERGLFLDDSLKSIKNAPLLWIDTDLRTDEPKTPIYRVTTRLAKKIARKYQIDFEAQLDDHLMFLRDIRSASDIDKVFNAVADYDRVLCTKEFADLVKTAEAVWAAANRQINDGLALLVK